MPKTPTMRLYGYWRSMAAYRVRVALNLKGLAAQETPIDLDAGEQLAPAFLAVNPEGAVPALIDEEGRAITQSMAILEYLEERFPDPPLLPADPTGRARVRSLAAVVVSDTHPLMVPRVRTYLTANGMDERALRAWSLHWVARGLGVIEARLARDAATGVFSHGDRPTLADLCLASLAVPIKTFGVDVAPYPTVARIVDACEKLDAFARAHPRLQAGAPA
jgi:maleylacetoacetate isomerase/maleylpyruvate isomerase